MGLRNSWIAVRGLQREQALETLGMEVAQPLESGCLPDDIALATLPGGWLIGLADGSADAFDGDLVKLVALGSAVGCAVNETVMYSEARAYEGGVEIWRVVHDPDADESLYSLQITGNPPPQLDAIVGSVRAEQDAEGGEEADVDLMFDIPTKLAQSLCGFSLEDDLDPFGFVEVQIPGKARRTGRTDSRPGFFARLFGRG